MNHNRDNGFSPPRRSCGSLIDYVKTCRDGRLRDTDGRVSGSPNATFSVAMAAPGRIAKNASCPKHSMSLLMSNVSSPKTISPRRRSVNELSLQRRVSINSDKMRRSTMLSNSPMVDGISSDFFEEKPETSPIKVNGSSKESKVRGSIASKGSMSNLAIARRPSFINRSPYSVQEVGCHSKKSMNADYKLSCRQNLDCSHGWSVSDDENADMSMVRLKYNSQRRNLKDENSEGDSYFFHNTSDVHSDIDMSSDACTVERLSPSRNFTGVSASKIFRAPVPECITCAPLDVVPKKPERQGSSIRIKCPRFQQAMLLSGSMSDVSLDSIPSRPQRQSSYLQANKSRRSTSDERLLEEISNTLIDPLSIHNLRRCRTGIDDSLGVDLKDMQNDVRNMRIAFQNSIEEGDEAPHSPTKIYRRSGRRPTRPQTQRLGGSFNLNETSLRLQGLHPTKRREQISEEKSPNKPRRLSSEELHKMLAHVESNSGAIKRRENDSTGQTMPTNVGKTQTNLTTIDGYAPMVTSVRSNDLAQGMPVQLSSKSQLSQLGSSVEDNMMGITVRSHKQGAHRSGDGLCTETDELLQSIEKTESRQSSDLPAAAIASLCSNMTADPESSSSSIQVPMKLPSLRRRFHSHESIDPTSISTTAKFLVLRDQGSLANPGKLGIMIVAASEYTDVHDIRRRAKSVDSNNAVNTVTDEIVAAHQVSRSQTPVADIMSRRDLVTTTS